MKSHEVTGLIQLIQQTRNQLWIKSALHSLNISLWISVILVMITTIGHLIFAWPNSNQIGFGLAILPPLLTSLFCLLFQRPSMDVASRTADKKLNANSLLVSAWDIVRCSSNNADMSQLVISQALRETPKWHSQTKTGHALRLSYSSLLAIASLLIGIIMLSLPGGTQFLQNQSNNHFAQTTQVEVTNPLANITHSINPPATPTRNLKVPKNRGNMSTTLQSNTAENKPAPVSNRGVLSQQPLPVVNKTSTAHLTSKSDTTTLTTSKHSSLSSHKAGKKQQDLAGNSKPIEDAQPVFEEVSAIPTTTIKIKRTGDTAISSYIGNPQEMAAAGFSPLTRPSTTEKPITSARIEKSSYYASDFTLSQQDLIAHYFQQLHAGAIK